jgi:hypothetical protein
MKLVRGLKVEAAVRALVAVEAGGTVRVLEEVAVAAVSAGDASLAGRQSCGGGIGYRFRYSAALYWLLGKRSARKRTFLLQRALDAAVEQGRRSYSDQGDC